MVGQHNNRKIERKRPEGTHSTQKRETGTNGGTQREEGPAGYDQKREKKPAEGRKKKVKRDLPNSEETFGSLGSSPWWPHTMFSLMCGLRDPSTFFWSRGWRSSSPMMKMTLVIVIVILFILSHDDYYSFDYASGAGGSSYYSLIIIMIIWMTWVRCIGWSPGHTNSWNYGRRGD